MKYMEKIFRQVASRIFIPPKPVTDLLYMVEECRHAWQYAKKEFDMCDREMVDYMVFKLNAAERQYMALLAKARREGLKAWPDEIAAAAARPECAEKQHCRKSIEIN